MEQFKLRSIEELDLDFVSSLNKNSSADNNETIIIPEINKEETELVSSENTENNNVISYFKKPAQQLDEEPAYSPQSDESQKSPRPLVPIGQNKSVYSPVGAPEENEEEFALSDETDYGDVEVENKKSKKSLVGKIISIVLLAATVVTFMLGCFVSIFLDNNGSDIGGMCFSTMSADVEQINVSKGDLIISKKAEISEYASGKMVAVPSVSENGCDIHVINYVNGISSEEAELSTTNITSDSSYASSVMASSCLGIINSYIPVLGGLLTFAMENAILVCILFVLLSAFWCLLLVLIEKSASTPKTKKDQ